MKLFLFLETKIRNKTPKNLKI